jgi:hypothetical protein
VKVDSLLDQTKCMQNRSIVVHYQHRFAAHLDEAIDGEVGEPVTGLRNLWVNLLQFGLDLAAGS